jgi:hypothetical protein
MLTPGHYYQNELWGDIIPVGVYALTGFFSATACYWAVVALVGPGRFASVRVAPRVCAIVIIFMLAYAVAIGSGLTLTSCAHSAYGDPVY